MEYSCTEYKMIAETLVRCENSETLEEMRMFHHSLTRLLARFVLKLYLERTKNPLNEYESILKMSEARNKVAEEQIKESERRINLKRQRNLLNEYMVNSSHDEEKESIRDFNYIIMRNSLISIIEQWLEAPCRGDKDAETRCLADNIINYLRDNNGS